MSEGLQGRGSHEVPPPKPGPDPWCSWCDEDMDGDMFFIDGEIWDWNYPPAFCSPECAREWGNAAHEERPLLRLSECGTPQEDSTQ